MITNDQSPLDSLTADPGADAVVPVSITVGKIGIVLVVVGQTSAASVPMFFHPHSQ